MAYRASIQGPSPRQQLSRTRRSGEIIEKYFEGFHGNKVLPSFPKEMQATNNGSLFCRRDVDGEGI